MRASSTLAETTLTVQMDFDGFDDFWHPLLGGTGQLGSFVSSLPAPTRQRLEAAVRSAYLSGAPDGPRSFPATAWVVRGTTPGG